MSGPSSARYMSLETIAPLSDDPSSACPSCQPEHAANGFVTLLTDGARAPVCAARQADIPAAWRHSVMASPRKCRWVLALVSVGNG
jgi:hypothetical protein